MTASEDPAPQPGTPAPGDTRPGDELENWLSDLRTEVAADPPGWITEDAGDPSGWITEDAGDDEQPADRLPHPRPAPDDSRPSTGGRHRVPD